MYCTLDMPALKDNSTTSYYRTPYLGYFLELIRTCILYTFCCHSIGCPSSYWAQFKVLPITYKALHGLQPSIPAGPPHFLHLPQQLHLPVPGFLQMRSCKQARSRTIHTHASFVVAPTVWNVRRSGRIPHFCQSTNSVKQSCSEGPFYKDNRAIL